MLKKGASSAVVCSHWSDGGVGCLELADAVIEVCKKQNQFKLLYENEMSLLDKMNTIAQNMYGADKVVLTPKAEQSLQKLVKAVSLKCLNGLLSSFFILFSIFLRILFNFCCNFLCFLGFWSLAHLHV